jgi:hypothetical protein
LRILIVDDPTRTAEGRMIQSRQDINQSVCFIKNEEVISVTAKDGASTEIRDFEGTSSLGGLADESDITLTRSPGGPLGTLLVVLAKGTIHEERY